jgi:hypothetical protein
MNVGFAVSFRFVAPSLVVDTSTQNTRCLRENVLEKMYLRENGWPRTTTTVGTSYFPFDDSAMRCRNRQFGCTGEFGQGTGRVH